MGYFGPSKIIKTLNFDFEIESGKIKSIGKKIEY